MKLPPEPGLQRHLWHATPVDAPLPARLRFILSSVAEVSAPSIFPIHRHHHEYEVLAVETGAYACHLDGRLVRLDAGDAIVIRPGETHEDLLAPPLRYGVVHFALNEGDAVACVDVFEPDTPPEQRRLRGAGSLVLAAVTRLARENECGDGFGLIAQQAVVAQLLVDLLRLLPERVLVPAWRPRERAGGFAQRLLTVFAQHAHKRLDLATMAGALGLTKRALIHRCAKELGAAPAHAFAEFRLKRALLLLRETTLPVHEVAAAVGFPDQFHFSRAFKRVHGVAPSAVRRRG